MEFNKNIEKEIIMHFEHIAEKIGAPFSDVNVMSITQTARGFVVVFSAKIAGARCQAVAFFQRDDFGSYDLKQTIMA